MQWSQPKTLAPEPQPVGPSAKLGAFVELLKWGRIVKEVFGSENNAKAEAFSDKATFYFSINLVNNYFNNLKKQGYSYPAWADNVFNRSWLINFVNDGSLPFSQTEIDKLKKSNNQLDQMTGLNYEKTNEFIKGLGTQIYLNGAGTKDVFPSDLTEKKKDIKGQ